MIPIFPCGYTVDVARVCRVFAAKLWKNSDQTVVLRFYRTPPGNPTLPLLHAFMLPEFYPDKWLDDPGEGEIGLLKEPLGYTKGQLPPQFFPPVHYCGDQRQWLEGSVLGVDPPLVFTLMKIPVCCGSANRFLEGGARVGGGATFASGVRVGGRTTIVVYINNFVSGPLVEVGGGADFTPGSHIAGGVLVGGGGADFTPGSHIAGGAAAGGTATFF